MFEARYGRQVTQARTVLTTAAGEIAARISALIKTNPVFGTDPFLLSAVRAELVDHQAELATALSAYPLAIGVDAEGRLDRFGRQLADLMGALSRTVVLYQGLKTLPAALESAAHREFEALRGAADGVVILAAAGRTPAG